MKKYFFSIICMLVTFPALAQQTTMKTLDKAYMEALQKQHKQAIARIVPLLDSYALTNVDEIVLAHQILAYSYCESGNQTKAEEHTKALYAFSPNEDFRVFNPSPECNKLLKSKPVAPASSSKKK